MENKREHRRLDLTPDEWRRLEEIAKAAGARPKHGINAHQVDWRALIRDIARGDAVVTPAKENDHLRRVDEALAKIKEHTGAGGTYRQLSILEAAQS